MHSHTNLSIFCLLCCSFGESAQLLHPFHHQFNDQTGAKILRLCQFQQKKTRIAQVNISLDFLSFLILFNSSNFYVLCYIYLYYLVIFLKWWLSDSIPLQIKNIWNIFIFQFLETSTNMFMAAKQQTPGSTNTGKIIDHIDVNKAALSYKSCLLSDPKFLWFVF